MIRKFSTYEEASFFVEEKKAEGYHATILNEGTGFLWGPRTVGGFRVFVSDEPGTLPDEELQKLGEDDSFLTRALRYAFVAVLLIGVITAIISAFVAFGTTLRLALALLGVLLVILVGGYMFSRFQFRQPPE